MPPTEVSSGVKSALFTMALLKKWDKFPRRNLAHFKDEIRPGNGGLSVLDSTDMIVRTKFRLTSSKPVSHGWPAMIWIPSTLIPFLLFMEIVAGGVMTKE